MTMDYAGAAGVVVNSEHIQAVAPEEWKALLDFLAQKKTNLNELAQALFYDELILNVSEEDNFHAESLLNDLRDTFLEVTQLVLYLDYHNSRENGSDLDEVNGAFFSLDMADVYQLTPSGQKLAVLVGSHWVFLLYFWTKEKEKRDGLS